MIPVFAPKTFTEIVKVRSRSIALVFLSAILLTGCDYESLVKSIQGFTRRINNGTIDVLVVSFYDMDCFKPGTKNPWFCTADMQSVIDESVVTAVKQMQGDASLNIKFIKSIEDQKTVSEFYKQYTAASGINQRTEYVRSFASANGGNFVIFGLYFSANDKLSVSPVINWYKAGKEVTGEVKTYNKIVTKEDQDEIKKRISSQVADMLSKLYN